MSDAATELPTPDLQSAADVIDLADRIVGKAVRALADAPGGADANQVFAYDLAHAASAVATAKSLIDYGGKGEHEAAIVCAYTADMAHELQAKLLGREPEWGVERGALDATYDFVRAFRSPAFPGLAGNAARPASPQRRHGHGGRHVWFLRRQRHRSARRARPPDQR